MRSCLSKPTAHAGSVPSPAGSRPASASSLRSATLPAPRPGSGQPKTPLGLRLPLPAEITHQAWAVDDCQYKGLPLRPQPVLRIRYPFRGKLPHLPQS